MRIFFFQFFLGWWWWFKGRGNIFPWLLWYSFSMLLYLVCLSPDTLLCVRPDPLRALKNHLCLGLSVWWSLTGSLMWSKRYLEEPQWVHTHSLQDADIGGIKWENSSPNVSFTSLHHPPPSPRPNCTWFYFPVLQTMNSARLTWHKVPTNFVPATVDGRSMVGTIWFLSSLWQRCWEKQKRERVSRSVVSDSLWSCGL